MGSGIQYGDATLRRLNRQQQPTPRKGPCDCWRQHTSVLHCHDDCILHKSNIRVALNIVSALSSNSFLLFYSRFLYVSGMRLQDISTAVNSLCSSRVSFLRLCRNFRGSCWCFCTCDFKHNSCEMSQASNIVECVWFTGNLSSRKRLPCVILYLFYPRASYWRKFLFTWLLLQVSGMNDWGFHSVLCMHQ